jgi:hypothetical protein
MMLLFLHCFGAPVSQIRRTLIVQLHLQELRVIVCAVIVAGLCYGIEGTQRLEFRKQVCKMRSGETYGYLSTRGFIALQTDVNCLASSSLPRVVYISVA